MGIGARRRALSRLNFAEFYHALCVGTMGFAERSYDGDRDTHDWTISGFATIPRALSGIQPRNIICDDRSNVT